MCFEPIFYFIVGGFAFGKHAQTPQSEDYEANNCFHSDKKRKAR